jgi:flagellar hook-associated protein FlgK
MNEMSKEEMRKRVAEINERIASARQWGALLTALSEERNGLMRALSQMPVGR